MLSLSNSPSHVGNVLGRHMEHRIWQMLLREVQHEEDIVDRILDTGQVIDAHICPREDIRTVVGDEEGD